jgi:hypothetical protein
MLLLPESIHSPTNDMDATLATARHVDFIGQRVTVQRRTCLPGDAEWVVIGWEKGLPVAARPISTETLKHYLGRYDHTMS